MWYHNIQNLLRNWYFVQTAAINPAARDIKVSDEIMGDLIRFVAAHEVGHTLGLPHNMGSSVAYPVDSLRSKSFTDSRGTAPSIMDYARFNYVAQPGDGVTQLYPQVGDYDKWSIEWGYRLVPNVTDPEAEEPILNQWILDHSGDPVYRYGRQQGRPVDPTAQTEDLGDDSMKASEYGIANLKRIMPELLNWTGKTGKHFDDMSELYGQVIGQYNRYMGHVTANIGGVIEDFYTHDQDAAVYSHVTLEKQRRAMQFLETQLFDTPNWLIDAEILMRQESSGNLERINTIQKRTLNNLLNTDRLIRLSENETLNGNTAYGPSTFIDDLEQAIYKDLRSGSVNDVYRRNLQKALVAEYHNVLATKDDGVLMSDVPSLIRGSLMNIQALAAQRINAADKMTKLHAIDLKARIDEILDMD
jgi:hypothetical protein